MKLLIIALLMTSIYAKEKEMVPLDVKAGKWKSTVKNVGKDMLSALIDQMPEGPQKAQIKKMVNEKVKKAQKKKQFYCLKQEEINNPDSIMKKFAANNNTKKCKMKLTRSTSKNMDFNLVCTQLGMKVTSIFKFEAKNPKLMVGNGKILSPGAGIPEQKFSIKSKWLKETCH